MGDLDAAGMIAMEISLEVPRVDWIEVLVAGVRAGEPRALARAISLLEAGGQDAAAILEGCRLHVQQRLAAGHPRALRIGVTGAAGVGKSTLVDQMVCGLRAAGTSVGVVAVDPTSPYTGGALLGDRIRMQRFCGDPGVTIRSFASRGAPGGIGRAAEAAAWAMEAAGREIVVIETVGVGQDEVAVAALADVVVLVLAPGMGDDVQAMKAGIIEIADVFAINKADRAGAEILEAELLQMQSLSPEHDGHVPVVRTVAATGEGVVRLMEAVREVAATRSRRAAHPAKIPTVDQKTRTVDQKTLTVDHLGIAVRDLASARGFYEQIGLRGGVVEVVEHEGVRLLMLAAGESRIELLEPMGEQTTIGRFLAKRGEGLHHVAFRTADVEAAFSRLRTRGVRLVNDTVQAGAGGHRYFFVHPASTGGVLVELVGERSVGEPAEVGEASG